MESINIAIRQALLADDVISELVDGVYHLQAPQVQDEDGNYDTGEQVNTPYIIFRMIDGSPEYNFGNVTDHENFMYETYCIAEPTESNGAEEIAEMLRRRIYAVLQNAELNIEGYAIMSFRKDRDISGFWETNKSGMQWYHGAITQWEIMLGPS